jgi:hypothetical protein
MPYDKTLIVNIHKGDDESAKQIFDARHARLTYKNQKKIKLSDQNAKPDERERAYSASTSDTRIYLIAHSGQTSFGGWSADQLADHLRSHGLKHAKRIVLFGCESTAVAKKFHELIARAKNLEIEVESVKATYALPAIRCEVAGYRSQIGVGFSGARRLNANQKHLRGKTMYVLGTDEEGGYLRLDSIEELALRSTPVKTLQGSPAIVREQLAAAKRKSSYHGSVLQPGFKVVYNWSGDRQIELGEQENEDD